MGAAVEIFNKFEFPYRTESFTILAINAWELLLKARWLALHGNNPRCLYLYQTRHNVDGSPGNRRYIKRTRAGAPFTIGVDRLARKMLEANELDVNAQRNLLLISELRNCATHFYDVSQSFESRLYGLSAACVKNFGIASKDWFGIELGGREAWLMPLALSGPLECVDVTHRGPAERQFLEFAESYFDIEPQNGSPYSVAINFEIRFTQSGSQNAIAARLTNDPTAVAIQLTEEQIKARYPWDYKQLYEACQRRYSDFKVDANFHSARKTVEGDQRFAWIRYLDPANPRSTKKILYSPNIVQEFDRRYSQR